MNQKRRNLPIGLIFEVEEELFFSLFEGEEEEEEEEEREEEEEETPEIVDPFDLDFLSAFFSFLLSFEEEEVGRGGEEIGVMSKEAEERGDLLFLFSFFFSFFSFRSLSFSLSFSEVAAEEEETEAAAEGIVEEEESAIVEPEDFLRARFAEGEEEGEDAVDAIIEPDDRDDDFRMLRGIEEEEVSEEEGSEGVTSFSFRSKEGVVVRSEDVEEERRGEGDVEEGGARGEDDNTEVDTE
jgi:hypothetical protein